jgi:large subunit ribosomal protein L30
MSERRKIRVTQVRSAIGFDRRQRATLRGLGILRHQQSALVEDTPAVRGMIAKVIHLLKVED